MGLSSGPAVAGVGFFWADYVLDKRPPCLNRWPEFLPRLFGVLSVLVAGDINVADAAERVGCSRWPLWRYLVGLTDIDMSDERRVYSS